MQITIDTWVAVIVPFLCVLLTYFLTKMNERKKGKADSYKALQQENDALKAKLDLYEAVEPSKNEDYYILKATGETICPTCWGAEHKPIPVRDNGTGHYICARCNGTGVFNKAAVSRLESEMERINCVTPLDF